MKNIEVKILQFDTCCPLSLTYHLRIHKKKRKAADIIPAIFSSIK